MFFVYILASQPHGTLYVGSTPDLIRRIWEHKTKAISGSPRNMVSIGWSGTRCTSR
jgi:predicted GIY-YIG superfamily endonuclease